MLRDIVRIRALVRADFWRAIERRSLGNPVPHYSLSRPAQGCGARQPVDLVVAATEILNAFIKAEADSQWDQRGLS
jgi:hypothetical protein